MERTIKLTTFAVGSLVLLCVSSVSVRAQGSFQPQAVTHVASLAPGSILGIVSDERGVPVSGAIVSALGATTAVVISDRAGRFELRTLTPGPYLVRAHLSGYIAPRGQVVEVRSSARTASTIALRRAPSTLTTDPASTGLPVLTAGVSGDAAAQPTDAAVAPETADRSPDNHGEIAWRLRHARRGILKDADIPDEIFVSDTPPNTNIFGHGSMW